MSELSIRETVYPSEYPHEIRRQTLFDLCMTLGMGEGIEIIHEHEPKPLRELLTAQWGDDLVWLVLEDRPNHCRVHVGRSA